MSSDSPAEQSSETAAQSPPESDGDSDENGTSTGIRNANRTDTEDEDEKGGAREVVVPMRVYKSVTVFSTLYAVAAVVGGFIVIDTATNRATASVDEINAGLALLGIGLIVSGAVVYAFSTRFQAEGMRKAKDDTDEGTDNG